MAAVTVTVVAIPRRSNIENNDGFAFPVSELPSDTLVPIQREKECTSSSSSFSPRVAFRYKKDSRGDYSSSITTYNNYNNDSANFDASTLYLIVKSLQDDQTINVYLRPSHSTPNNTHNDNQRHSPKWMAFRLDSNVNLQGMRAALDKRSPASPVLFYKSLGLEQFRKCTFS